MAESINFGDELVTVWPARSWVQICQQSQKWVTLGSHSSGSLTKPRCKIWTRPWLGKSKLTPRIHYVQVTESAGNGASTLALKPMGGVNWSPKQRVPVAPQNVDIVTENSFKKKKKFDFAKCKYSFGVFPWKMKHRWSVASHPEAKSRCHLFTASLIFYRYCFVL